MDKVLLIDGMNNMWRANTIFGKPPEHKPSLADPNICDCKVAWNAEEGYCYSKFSMVYSFFRNLRATIEEFQPDKCFFVLEGHPQFRYDLYPEYKANRIIKIASKQETHDLFHENKKHILRILQHLPITQIKAANYEADDVVGTLCEDLKEEKVTILSNDSDFTQLLQRGYKNLQLYNPIKKEYVKAPAYPYVAWKALAGDTSDNIKKLLTPKKVEKMMSDPDALKDFLSLEENRCNFIINRDLIQIRNVPSEELLVTEGVTNTKAIEKEFQDLKFKALLEEKTWKKFITTFNCIKF